MKELEQLQPWFDKLQIQPMLYTHIPLYTSEQAIAHTGHIPGKGCKNLFLKDSKKRVWLIVALYTTTVQLKPVSKALQAPELRFADETWLKEYLGVTPGSVTPFGLINDINHSVNVVIDNAIFKEQQLMFHPLRNDATVLISPQDLIRFIEICGNNYQIMDFQTLELVNKL